MIEYIGDWGLDPPEPKIVGTCPKCGGDVYRYSDGDYCADEDGCGWRDTEKPDPDDFIDDE